MLQAAATAGHVGGGNRGLAPLILKDRDGTNQSAPL